ncbi:hypothetical protein SMAC4_12940 [Sordaria macrospora]|uniref:uncharacterized protein n=1 Tax=Sordaria macrospora TaxID=5147 RepID=UPI001DAD22FC|nr:hypothetical protein B0T09DRAFT_116836 [Sordaria sp. MPI-SDFR-AT-0083]WPJ63456.1 hypothetical protein SMAC4_12940 [Sordaria macrospora]
MSADLFAAFGASSQDQSSQSTQNNNNDPFSFLASDNSTFPPQQPQTQQPKPPQPHQQQQPVSVSIPWPSVLPNSQPPQSNVWGDLGTLGGSQGGFQSFQSVPPVPVPPKPAAPDVEDEDGWGDFEVAAPTTTAQPTQPTPSVFSATSNAEPPRNRLIRSPTLDLVSNKLVNLDLSWTATQPSDSRPTQKQKPVIKPIRNADPNVLFDADDFELQEVDGEDDDDEFGDFEGTSSPAPAFSVASSGTKEARKQPPGLFLSGGNSQTLYPEAPKSPYASSHTRKLSDVKELKIKTPVASDFPKEVKDREPSPVTAWPSGTGDGFGDDWDEFKDLSVTKTKTPAKTAGNAKAPAKRPDLDSSFDSDWKDWGETENNTPKVVGVASPTAGSDKSPPPTNVPPPSILLSTLPQLLDLSKTCLLKIKALPAAKQHAVVSDPATMAFLRGYLALATVTGRIIAGRKQRWQRDKFLLQGMSISAAGGMRGMKLATVDKTQSARDDHSAVAVLDVWSQQEGSLRSTVTAANAASDTKLRVPQLKLALQVHVAKNVPTAPKPCVVCGLKRDERVTGVDFDVEDSFGEWWIDFWGHRACKNFWVEHEAKLRQR